MKPVDPTEDKGFSLRRWSQRKAAARAVPRANAQPGEMAQAAAGTATVTATPVEERRNVTAAPVEERRADAPGSPGADVPATHPHAKPASATPLATDAAARAPASSLPPASALPSIDTLGIDSDFKAFMQPGVDESLKRGALKKLFSDPRFNVMDGLDVYIDDYSKPDPLDPAIVRTLAQARYIFNPPATRVTAEGHVEDIPEEELRAAARDAGSEAAAGPDAEGQDVAAVLPGVHPQDDAVPPMTHSQDDAMPATKAKPEAA